MSLRTRLPTVKACWKSLLSVLPVVPVSNPKLVFSWVVWALYAVISFLMWRHVTSPRRTAWLAVIGFILPFISLWIVTHA